MATVSSGMTDLELLHRFVGAELTRGGRSRPVDKVLTEFRQDLADDKQLREENRSALERSLRGESKPFNADAFLRRGSERLRERGIAG